jgi:hypothetical protein
MDNAPQSDQAMLIRLPLDWVTRLSELAVAPAEVLVHPDTGLDAQGAYLSMSVPSPAPELPRAVWVDLAPIMELANHNTESAEVPTAPLVLAAGQHFVVSEVPFGPEFMRRCSQALLDAGKPP